MVATTLSTKSLTKTVGVKQEVPSEVKSKCSIIADILATNQHLSSLDIYIATRDQLTLDEVEYYLTIGFVTGYFKQVTAINQPIKYTLNLKKRKNPKSTVRKTGFRRPNYGIGRAVVNALNTINGPFYIPQVLNKIENDFPVATVFDIEVVVKRLLREKTPGLLETNGCYLRKQPIIYKS